jgi:hypothetical protein
MKAQPSPLEAQLDVSHQLALTRESASRWPLASLLDLMKTNEVNVGFTRALRARALENP